MAFHVASACGKETSRLEVWPIFTELARFLKMSEEDPGMLMYATTACYGSMSLTNNRIPNDILQRVKDTIQSLPVSADGLQIVRQRLINI
jgi:hypothetical protein